MGRTWPRIGRNAPPLLEVVMRTEASNGLPSFGASLFVAAPKAWGDVSRLSCAFLAVTANRF